MRVSYNRAVCVSLTNATSWCFALGDCGAEREQAGREPSRELGLIGRAGGAMGGTISTLVFQPPPATFLHNKKHFWLQTRNQHRIPVFHVERRCATRACDALASMIVSVVSTHMPNAKTQRCERLGLVSYIMARTGAHQPLGTEAN